MSPGTAVYLYGVVRDGEKGAVRLVAHGDSGSRAGCIARDIGQSLLGAPEQRQACLCGQRPAGPVDPECGVCPGVAAEIIDKGAQLVQGGQPVAAQGTDGLPRVSEPCLGQLG